MKKIFTLIIICFLGIQTPFAHIGSPGVVMQGKAGSYNLMVNVEPPDVIPGVAKVTVYMQGEEISIVNAPDGKPAELDAYLGMGGHAAVIRNDGNVYIHMHPAGTVNMAAQNVLKKRVADTTKLAIYPTDAKAFSDSVDTWIQYVNSLPEALRDSLLTTDMPFENNMGATMQMDRETHSNMLSFPYMFPAAGQYRIWVQVKRNGQVLTAAFDKLVE
jgi:hypothetical protein